MSTTRIYEVHSYPSLVAGTYFALVKSVGGDRTVHKTALYDSYDSAEGAAHDWARYSQSRLAKSLGSSNGG